MMSRKIKYDPKRDYYKIIGVSPSDDVETIQRAYRKLAKAYHPDLNQERYEWAKEQFQDLNEAYSILSDPDTKRQYDQLRWPYQTHNDGYRAPFSRQYGASSSRPSSSSSRGFNYADYMSAAEKAQQKAHQSTSTQERPSYAKDFRYAPPKVSKPLWQPHEPRGLWLNTVGMGWLRPIYEYIVNLMSSPYRYILWGLAALLLINSIVIIISSQASFSDSESSTITNSQVTATLLNPQTNSSASTAFQTATPSVIFICSDNFRFIEDADILHSEEDISLNAMLNVTEDSTYTFEIIFVDETNPDATPFYTSNFSPKPLEQVILESTNWVNTFGKGEGRYRLQLTVNLSQDERWICSRDILYQTP